MRRWLSLLSILLLLPAGCSRQSEPAPEPAPAPPAVTTIRFWQPDWNPHWEALIAAFHDAEPSIRVMNINPRPGGNMSGIVMKDEALLSTIRSGAAEVVPLRVADLKESDLLPLDPFLQRDQVDETAFGGLLDALRREGKLTRLPVTTAPVMLLYSRDAFTAAGLPLPRPGWTWAEFQEAAARLTSGEGDSKVWGVADASLGQLRLPLTLLRHEAAEILAKQGALPAHRTEAARAAFLSRNPASVPGTELLFDMDLRLLRGPDPDPGRQATLNAYASTVTQLVRGKLGPDQVRSEYERYLAESLARLKP